MKEKYETLYIDGEETIYMISNKGTCINMKRGTVLNPHKIRRQNKRLVPVDPENCYYEYVLYHNKRYYYMTIGRLVAEYFIPIPQKYLDMGLTMNDLEVDHIDEYRPNNKYTNLQWLTKEENYRKMINSGHFRVPYGSLHGSCKYTSDQLNIVGQLLEDNKMRIKQISKITGVPTKTISAIINKQKFVYLYDMYRIENFNFYEKRKIDIEVIKEIIELIQNSDLSLSKFAEKMGVSKSLVKDIYKRRVHKELSKNYDFSKRPN